MADIDGNQRIFGPRFIDDIEKEGDGFLRKSRLVSQDYDEEGAYFITTKAPNVQRFSKRLKL